MRHHYVTSTSVRHFTVMSKWRLTDVNAASLCRINISSASFHCHVTSEPRQMYFSNGSSDRRANAEVRNLYPCKTLAGCVFAVH